MSSHPDKKAKSAPPEEAGEKAPIWIISFADMISLLMAFFVMLLTMAHTQSGKLGNRGEGIFEKTLFGFKSSISGFGLPGLFGKAGDPNYFEYGKSHYNLVGDSNEADQRVISANEENVRRLFKGLQKNMNTYARQTEESHPAFVVTPITFHDGQITLDDAAKQFLTRFTIDLEQSTKPLSAMYVIAIARENLPENERWLLSTKRAQAVGDFLQSILQVKKNVPLYCWGSDSDSQWVSKELTDKTQPQILITALHGNN